MALEKLDFASGLTAYVDQMPGILTNEVNMFIPYGSVDERPGNEGVAHALEHCVHLETAEFESRQALREHAKLNGMRTNANTSYTRTVYIANGTNIDTSMRHLSQVLTTTKFPEDKVAHEMNAIQREAKQRLDDIDLLHELAADQAMFGSPFGRDVIGFHGNLDFERDVLHDVYTRNYTLGNMVLVVTGAASPREVEASVLRHFGESGADTNPDTLRTDAVLQQEALTTGYLKDDSSNLRMSWSYPVSGGFLTRFQEDFVRFGIATYAMSEECFEQMRNQKGISYGGSINFAGYNHPSAWRLSGQVSTDAEHADTARGVFREIFTKEGATYDEAQMQGALAMYRYMFLKRSQSPEGRGDNHIGRLERRRQPEDMASIVVALSKITIEEVRNTIDEIIGYAADLPKFEHLTGTREAVGNVDQLITRDQIL
jgi:predicted Zn-dependent peptidase